MLFKSHSKIKNKLELVSIHIPKTAGTSFRNILKAVYGEENAVRLDIKTNTNRIELENEVFEKSKLPKNIKVIHGHFYFANLIECFDIKPDVPIITWLRHPVERVVSNYFYLSKRLAEELDEEKKGLNILAKMQKTLIEYASGEINRNRMSKFLKGIDLKDLAFVGFNESYNEDLEKLSAILEWDSYPVFEHNVTGEKREVSEEDIKTIESLNKEDIELYYYAKRLRNKS